MKVLTPAISLAVLLGVLVILPGCGGDETVPIEDNNTPTTADPAAHDDLAAPAAIEELKEETPPPDAVDAEPANP